MNRQIKRALSTAAAVSLGLAGLVGAAAPAQAALPSTSFKIHLNVPKEVAEQWNIWYWNTGNDGVGPSDNTLGSLTKNIKETATAATGTDVTQDWTPNFIGEDAYGAYAEFTLPVTLTALNNVMRTTESWDGQAAAPAVPAVVDNPATPNVDETAEAIPAKVAIPKADKPFGGDNIFPAGESWWNVHTGLREYPLTKTSDYKVYINAKLKDAQAQGWNVYTWNTTVAPKKLVDYVVSTSKVVTSKVKGKTVKKTVVTKTYPYKGKVGAATTGFPFVGEDKYGAFAIIKTATVYAGTVGVIARRSTPTNDWAKQSSDFKNDAGAGFTNGLKSDKPSMYLALGQPEKSPVHYTAPTFVGRWSATAAFAAGQLTVTPVAPAHPSMKGMFPTKIVVTAKKGGTTLTCTIESKATAADIATAAWALPSNCSMPVTAPLAGGEAQTWEVFVQASAPSVGTAVLGPEPAAKVVISPPAS
jgi:hypothetical protein